MPDTAGMTSNGFDYRPIKPERVDAWLRLYVILDARARAFYEHRLAA